MSSEISRWCPPPNGVFKLNTEAILLHDESCGIGAVIRDSKGTIMAAASWKVNKNLSVSLAKAMALRSGLFLACDLGFLEVIVESDCKECILALEKFNVRVDSSLRALLFDCHKLALNLRRCSWQFVDGDANKVAQFFAMFAIKNSCFFCEWIEDVPCEAVHLATCDVLVSSS